MENYAKVAPHRITEPDCPLLVIVHSSTSSHKKTMVDLAGHITPESEADLSTFIVEHLTSEEPDLVGLSTQCTRSGSQHAASG
jgi:hypothetical protein